MLRTGENEQGLKKVTDLTRWIALGILFIHFYFECYQVFQRWGCTAPLSDQLLHNIARTGLLKGFNHTKSIALVCLLISLLGVRGRKDEKASYRTGVTYLITGIVLFYGGGFLMLINSIDPAYIAVAYMSTTIAGVLFIIAGGNIISRSLKQRLKNQVFNEAGFPQEERLLKDPYSLNLPAEYEYQGRKRRSWINFLNSRRSILVLGSAGSGKSYFVIENLLRQLIAQHKTLLVFDHKFPELSLLTYNHFLQHKDQYPPGTTFRCINFTDLNLSNRCNPIHPFTLTSLSSAIESSKSLLLSMNKTWAGKQGEFFVDSPINLLAAVIGFLRNYERGRYCSIPHAIELIHQPYEKLFTILQIEPEIQTLMNPFNQAYIDGELETLNSQMASVKIPLGRISSPELYYILSGDDFTLSLNDPKQPTVLCLGNNPQLQEALEPIMSLYIDRINKVVNQPGKLPFAQCLDEFGRVRATSVMSTILTGRSNNIVSIIAVQDYSQLKLIYSKEEAETIFNITGNIISGQGSGESARLLSERFPKTFQDRESISINSGDTSISRSKQLEQSVPASTIASLSSGEFVGVVADNPDQPIKNKIFHSKIINNHEAIRKEKEGYQMLPVQNNVTKSTINQIFLSIKQDTNDFTDRILEEILNDPSRGNIIIKK
ncbi:MAG: YWFCY domain-containing protein [Pseudobacter sp.]|uniref:YWFCY domain-containing protein n=1 Tax=Pseudobacter sp. TaxID=2045420 RepID=UPI003F7EA9DF